MLDAVAVDLEGVMASARENLEHRVRHRLADVASGWEGAASVVDDGAVVVQPTHPYSEGLVFHSQAGVADDAAGAVDWIEEVLRDDAFTWQVQLFAGAPEPTGGGHAVRAVRMFSELFAWRNIEVRAVAGLLVDLGVLSDAEHQWAQRHLGEDPPAGPGPNPDPSRWRR